MKQIITILVTFIFFSSCASKKEILYLQDSDNYDNSIITYTSPTIQPNDVLKITVGALSQEAIIPYNRKSLMGTEGGGASSNMIELDGYLVSNDNTVNFPQLGDISTKDKTVTSLQKEIKRLLEADDQLKNATVDVRLVNAKVTILGEVGSPGVYKFTEENITLLQALGLAGDLTIQGKREDILFIREVDGVRQVAHLDLTTADIFKSPFFLIKPNDVIIVNPNGPKVTSAGYLGSLGATLSIVTLLITTTILLTR